MQQQPLMTHLLCPADSLLMFTENTEAWHKAICTHYSHHKKRGICSGRQIVIEETDSDPPLTINIYHNGTVMFQGSQASLSSINKNFKIIKSLTETTNQTPTDINNNTEIEKTQEEESCSTLDTPPQNDATDEPHLMDHSLMELRDRFTQMEIRQVELEQQLHTLQSAQTTVQPTTRSKNGERDMSALWTLLRELQDK